MIKMKLSEYEKEVLRTAMDDKNVWSNDVWVYGLFGEAGEFVDAYKKMMYHNHPYDKNKLLLELGDVLWYNTACINFMGGTLNGIIQMYHPSLTGEIDFADYHKKEISYLEDIHTDDEVKRFMFIISGSYEALMNDLESFKKKYRIIDDILNLREIARLLYLNFYVIATTAFAFDSDIDTVAKMNVEKLRKRYPDGFSSERSMHRDEESK